MKQPDRIQLSIEYYAATARMRLPLLLLVALTAVLGVVGLTIPRTSRVALVGRQYHSPTTLLSTPVDFIEAEGSGNHCRIKVIGVGGGGGNAVNRMMESHTGVMGVELWTVNTDAQALSRSLAPRKLNIGQTTSR